MASTTKEKMFFRKKKKEFSNSGNYSFGQSLLSFGQKGKRKAEDAFSYILNTWSVSSSTASSNKRQVNIDSVIRNSTAMSCIEKKASTIGQLEFDIFFEDEEGDLVSYKHSKKKFTRAKRIYAKQIYQLLCYPNEVQTSSSFLRQLSMSLDLYGEAYIYFEREDDTKIEQLPTAMYILDPIYIQSVATNSKYPKYQINSANGSTDAFINLDPTPNGTYLTYFNIGKIVKLPLQGIAGINTSVSSPDLFELSNGADALCSQVLINSAKVTKVFSTPNRLTEDQAKNLKKNLEESLTNIYSKEKTNVGGVAILSEDSKLDNMPMPSIQDTDLREMQDQSMARICGLYGVPKDLLSIGDSKFNDSKVSWNQFNSTVIFPIIKMVEEVLNRQLFRNNKELFLKFDIENLIKGDLIDQANQLSVLVGKGIITPNEARKQLGKNAIEDEEADKLQFGSSSKADDIIVGSSPQDTGGGGNTAPTQNIGKK